MIVGQWNPAYTGVVLAVLAVVIFFALSRAQRRSAQLRRSDREGGMTHQHGQLRMEPSRAANELERGEVEMQEMARAAIGQIDTKLRLLQAMTAEADRAAARLETALAAVRATSAQPPTPATANAPTDPTQMAEAPTPTRESSPMRPEVADAAALSLSAAAPAAASPRSDAAGGERAPGAKARPRDEVCMLSDYGLTAHEIAARVGMPVGEVELILSLREARGKA